MIEGGEKESNQCSSASVVNVTSSLSRYAKYLKALYKTRPLATYGTVIQVPVKTYVKLALIKKERISRLEADYFTRLTLQGDIDQILQAKEPIEMQDIFKDDIRLAVIEGAPGIGKTTFAWELCRQWPRMESLGQFSLVVLLRLRDEGPQTAKCISDLLYHFDRALSRDVATEVEMREGEGVLFVFDGFDEFPASLRKSSLVVSIIEGVCLPKAKVLVTSRPSATAELQSLGQTSIGKHIEVVGFSQQEITKYVEESFQSKSQILASFQTYLSVNPVVRGMMYNPLNCSIVIDVYQYSYESDKPIPHTTTQLYTELVLSLLSRNLDKIDNSMASELHEQLHHIDPNSNLCKQLTELGRLAFEARVKEEVIFKELPDGCNHFGLFTTSSELYRGKKISYSFIHLTLQEYFGAYYISQQTADEQKRLFRENYEKKHLQVVWRFVAGLTKMQGIGWEVFGKEMEKVKCGYEIVNKMEIVNSIPKIVRTEVNVCPFFIQCLYESQDRVSCQSIFHELKLFYNGPSLSSSLDVYAMGYCVSACKNAWQVNLMGCGLGPELMDMLVHGLRSPKCCDGCIEELYLSRNHLADEGMQLFQDMPPQILQRIRQLALSDCDINRKGVDVLADLIPSMTSLTSLNIGLNPIGERGSVRLLEQLGKHQTVQTLHIDCASVGKDDITALAHVIRPPGALKKLCIGDTSMPQELVEPLVKTVLTSSSLKTLFVYLPPFSTPLDYIDTISDSLTHLKFHANPSMCMPTSMSSASLRPFSYSSSFSSSSGLSASTPSHLSALSAFASSSESNFVGSRLSPILRKNRMLKRLILEISLDESELRDILASLSHNKTLKTVQLSPTFHSQYFSASERMQLDPRIKW